MRSKQKKPYTKKVCQNLPSPNGMLRHNPFILDNLELIEWPWDMIFFGYEEPDYKLLRARIVACRTKRRQSIPKVGNKRKRLKSLVIALKTNEENYNE